MDNNTLDRSTEYKIIQVATNLFAHKGFEGASIRNICNEAQVNVSLISYYFGGKKELYKKVVDSIVKKVLDNMCPEKIESQIDLFKKSSKNEQIEIFISVVGKLIDFFYSNIISDEEIMIIFREQITSGIPINSQGYVIFKNLLALILDKNENDREVIFKCLTILAQVHSVRILKQFSLKMLNQKTYSKEDITVFKKVVLEQVRAIINSSEKKN